MVTTVADTVGLRRFTVEEYHRMGEAGVFGPEERVELVRGMIRQMSPKGRKHVIAVSKCLELFVLRLAGRARVYVQDPLPVKDSGSEPEPDIVVLSNPDPQAYGTGEAKALLVIEVADSSLDYDRNVKSSLYAEAEIPEYWIVNLVDNVVELRLNPEGGTYSSVQVIRPDESLAPQAWPDVEIRAGELLP